MAIFRFSDKKMGSRTSQNVFYKPKICVYSDILLKNKSLDILLWCSEDKF